MPHNFAPSTFCIQTQESDGAKNYHFNNIIYIKTRLDFIGVGF